MVAGILHRFGQNAIKVSTAQCLLQHETQAALGNGAAALNTTLMWHIPVAHMVVFSQIMEHILKKSTPHASGIRPGLLLSF